MALTDYKIEKEDNICPKCKSDKTRCLIFGEKSGGTQILADYRCRDCKHKWTKDYMKKW